VSYARPRIRRSVGSVLYTVAVQHCGMFAMREGLSGCGFEGWVLEDWGFLVSDMV
jgi:hypothetical protein